MVSLVPCRSITTCASRLNYIHSCPSDLQRHCAWISAVMFHSSSRHDVKTTVAVLCLPSSGSTASSSVYCRQASLSSFRRQHTTTFHRTSLVLQFYTVTRGFQTASQNITHQYIFIRNNQICFRNLNVRYCCKQIARIFIQYSSTFIYFSTTTQGIRLRRRVDVFFDEVVH